MPMNCFQIGETNYSKNVLILKSLIRKHTYGRRPKSHKLKILVFVDQEYGSHLLVRTLFKKKLTMKLFFLSFFFFLLTNHNNCVRMPNKPYRKDATHHLSMHIHT